MGSRPWYAFYPADYRRDTAHLSMIEHGAYRLLIDHYYSTGNLLPTQIQRMYRLTGAQAAEERSSVDFVLSEFFELCPGGYRHERIEQELEISRNFSDRASKAGLASAAKRQLETNLKSTSGQLETNCSQSQSQSQEQSQVTTTTTRTDTGRFVVFFDAMPRRMGRKAAEAAYSKAILKTSPEVIQAAAEKYKVHTMGFEDRYVLLPAKWLADERWSDFSNDSAKNSAFHSQEELDGQRKMMEKYGVQPKDR